MPCGYHKPAAVMISEGLSSSISRTVSRHLSRDASSLKQGTTIPSRTCCLSGIIFPAEQKDIVRFTVRPVKNGIKAYNINILFGYAGVINTQIQVFDHTKRRPPIGKSRRLNVRICNLDVSIGSLCSNDIDIGI